MYKLYILQTYQTNNIHKRLCYRPSRLQRDPNEVFYNTCLTP